MPFGNLLVIKPAKDFVSSGKEFEVTRQLVFLGENNKAVKQPMAISCPQLLTLKNRDRLLWIASPGLGAANRFIVQWAFYLRSNAPLVGHPHGVGCVLQDVCLVSCPIPIFWDAD